MSVEHVPRDRIDSYPTHRIAGYGVRPGRPMPFGATLVPGGVNFSVFSNGADAMSLVLYRRGAPAPMAELPFPRGFRVGGVFAMVVYGLDYEDLEYGYRAYGPERPRFGDRFDPTRVLADPYARSVSGRDVWGAVPDWEREYPYRSRLVFDDFDWDGDTPLRVPAEDLVVYEAHVRGFTRNPNSGVRSPGTYAGLAEKIPYLRELGVNCVELMPVFEFDEFENSRVLPGTGERLYNYWGYSTLGFYAPKAGYAATGRYGMQADELKTLVRQLHRAGIEVVLDVVFNHTAEGNENGPTISFRGLDNAVYYMLTPSGQYYNFSGTGNTFNCNHPVVRDFVLDCLRFWASEYHIDGFRFDLAAILDRDIHGAPLANPPLLESLAHDPVLRDCKLIAEAWDAGGLYQVGNFPNYGRWAEWNGKYRDTVRRFLKGDPALAGEMATRYTGSSDLYGGRGAVASVNFVTCHDGFTLNDLVSYDEKHNEANGEGNRDGADDNNSWNHGVEGPTDDPDIAALRLRQLKNAMAILLTSHGVPMLLAGDEVANTQNGNNNAYCHDSELSWFDWELVEKNAELLSFVRACVAFRHAHPVLRGAGHFRGTDYAGTGYQDLSWHGVRAWEPDWSPGSRFVASLRCGGHAKGGTVQDDFVYVAVNSHWEALDVELPRLPEGARWRVFADTSLPAPRDAHAPGTEPEAADQAAYRVGPRSVVVLVGPRAAAQASSDNPSD
ncbi:glycogen debranching protein GlgX [Actinorugispora endophytica]|uniref:Glycogen operon protein n=1 Tax=Actinorugispora endophytica TaxID=1605990 RepID=A0A4R6UJ95_9ACTN|nr:glycogen debranching protein GlgX [Actinorugispora endophytica]TDQ46901.1 glycogen operon protein [Actinorugispora endophytica]